MIPSILTFNGGVVAKHTLGRFDEALAQPRGSQNGDVGFTAENVLAKAKELY